MTSHLKSTDMPSALSEKLTSCSRMVRRKSCSLWPTGAKILSAPVGEWATALSRDPLAVVLTYVRRV